MNKIGVAGVITISKHLPIEPGDFDQFCRIDKPEVVLPGLRQDFTGWQVSQFGLVAVGTLQEMAAEGPNMFTF